MKTPIHFTSGGFTTIRNTSGQYTFKGTSLDELKDQQKEIQKRVSRMTRELTALRAVVNGKSILDPAAL